MIRKIANFIPQFDMIGVVLTLILIQVYLVAVAALCFTLIKLVRAYRQYRYRPVVSEFSESGLPAVSICLPARNETHSMSACLESVLASDYPKMEVIVLDDNSSDNTSYLIKAFAHAGVRFVNGGDKPDDWLGKNYSLESLLLESSGRYVLFMDVDTRFDSSTIRKLVEKALDEHVAMMSVIPQRYDMHRPSAWFSSLRYFWEIVLNRPSLPGSSSAVWLVDRHLLSDNLGGFFRWRDEVQPEMYIAKEMSKVGAYQLLISTPSLGVSYAKKWSSQIETGRRLLLPRFNNSIPSLLVGVGLMLAVLVSQFVGVYALIFSDSLILLMSLSLGVLVTIAFVAYSNLVWSRGWWIAIFVAPYIVWQELFLLAMSAIGYHRGTITWKGRPVSRPGLK